MAKVTKRDMFIAIASELIDNDADSALVDFVEHEIDLIDNRKTADRKPTKAQVENEVIKAGIVEVLGTVAEAYTATEVAGLMDISVQKASQLLRQLIEAGLVSKTEAHGKQKATFASA